MVDQGEGEAEAAVEPPPADDEQPLPDRETVVAEAQAAEKFMKLLLPVSGRARIGGGG